MDTAQASLCPLAAMEAAVYASAQLDARGLTEERAGDQPAIERGPWWNRASHMNAAFPSHG